MSIGVGNFKFGKNVVIPTPIPQNVAVLAAVTDIATFNNPNIKEILVKEPTRGGTFLIYTGAQADDQGVIFTDATGQRWKRVIESNYINIQWFGAIGVTVKQFDSYFPFVAAFGASLNVENVQAPNLYIPGVPAGTHYYFSTSVGIDIRVNIFGDGIQKSVIQFLNDIPGFTFNYITSRYSTVRDLTIKAYVLNKDINAHGFTIKDIVDFVNVEAQAFGANGFYLNNTIAGGGNSSTATFFNCLATGNYLHGFYIDGADANAMRFKSCEARENGGLGFLDSSFLGNMHDSWHLATNGGPDLAYQRGLASSGGTVYQALLDNFSGQAPPNATYWRDIGNAWIAFPNVLPYNAATNYYRVGAYFIEGINQYGAQLNMYTEGDQAPATLAPNTMALSGVQAAQIFGVYLYAVQSALVLAIGYQFKIGLLFTTPRYYAGQGLIGFGQASGSDVTMGWDNTFSGVLINGSIHLFGIQSTAANEGRTNLITAIMGTNKGYLMSLRSSRTVYKNIDIDSNKPTTSATWDPGDIMLMSIGNPEYLSEKPEIIACKRVAVPTAQWCRIAAYCEYEIATTNAVATTVFEDQFTAVSTNNIAKYDLDIVATNKATGDVYSQRRIVILYFATNAVVAVQKSSTVIETYSDAGLAACVNAFTLVTGNKTDLQITGIAATTINWKVSVRRTFL